MVTYGIFTNVDTTASTTSTAESQNVHEDGVCIGTNAPNKYTPIAGQPGGIFCNIKRRCPHAPWAIVAIHRPDLVRMTSRQKNEQKWKLKQTHARDDRNRVGFAAGAAHMSSTTTWRTFVMHFRIQGLPADQFTPLFALSDQELAER